MGVTPPSMPRIIPATLPSPPRKTTMGIYVGEAPAMPTYTNPRPQGNPPSVRPDGQSRETAAQKARREAVEELSEYCGSDVSVDAELGFQESRSSQPQRNKVDMRVVVFTGMLSFLLSFLVSSVFVYYWTSTHLVITR